MPHSHPTDPTDPNVHANHAHHAHHAHGAADVTSEEGCDCGHAHGARHIYVYSPSGAVRDKAAFRRGVRRLQALGHSVEVDRDALASSTRFAGDDDTRIAAIARAAASGADVALISRGGYGLTRILPGIDYSAVAKAVQGGMHFVGMSDFTAFQCAVLARTGAITWAGPSLCADFGVDTRGGALPDDIMEACFDDLLTGHGEGTGWRQPYARSRVAREGAAAQDVEVHDAPLWGGNLAVLAALVGTQWMPQIDGGVLFLEDVAEHPYRVERMLTQLLHAGVLERQKAVLLGQFTEFKLAPHDKGFGMDSVVQWLRSQIKAPVLTGLPFGHVATKVVLPMGARVDLASEGRDVMVVWGHTH